MGLPMRTQAQYWGAAAVVFFLVLWFLGEVILPFVVGGAIAYFLDPVADRLERMGLGRTAATVAISLFALLVLVLASLIIVPLMTDQLIGMAQAAPELVSTLQTYVSERVPSLADPESVVRRSIAAIAETVQSRGAQFAQQVLSGAISLLGAVIFIVVVPVVTFYLLLDWDNMIARIDELLPRDHAPTIRKLAGEIDAVLAGFVRGQLTVCLILGTFYSITLMVVGLQYGLVVGAIAGLLTFIPYVGSIVGGSLSIGLALIQFWGDPIWIGLVAAIFFVGQMVEGNFLTPKLVGSSVGLHPVWLLFALSAFGTLFGFVGMLVAVPVAASIGVLVRWGADRYTFSRLYKGLSGRAPEDE